MARRYEHGEIVGEPDAPVAFPEWLRRELDAVKFLDVAGLAHLGAAERANRAYARGRRDALRDVQESYSRAIVK